MIPKETVDKIIDEARIEEVVGDFVNLKKGARIYWVIVRFITKKHLRSLFLLPKEYTNVLVVVRLEILLIF